MKLIHLNEWLSIAANIGVLAGILFLIIEIGQQSESIDLSNELAIQNSVRNSADLQFLARSSILENPGIWHKGCAGSDLTLDESVVFVNMFQNTRYCSHSRIN